MGWLSRFFGRGRGRRRPDPSLSASEPDERRGSPRNWRVPAESPERPPRVTDDDDDGLAAAGVPRKPLPQNLSGGAAREIPKDDELAS